MDLRKADLRRINTATKYPSIPTYHALGDRGRLREERNVDFGDAPLVVTEKLDGTNTRIVLFDGGSYLVGSREELLHARGDLVHNPALGIVDAVRPLAERLAETLVLRGRVVTVYGETYGGKTTASKAYGTSVGFRVFDVVDMPVDDASAAMDASRLFAMEADAISRWREAGGQPFVGEAEIAALAARVDASTTPRLSVTAPLPTDVAGTLAWLSAALPGDTEAPLSGDRKGKPEGVVVRTADRSKIAKVRFEDYQRTVR